MTSTDLITIDTLKAADVFKPGAVAKILDDVEAKVRAIPPSDHTTEKGRKEIIALAYKITRSKTALDDMGKNHVAELKKAAGVVDADRRIIRDRLDSLKDEVRKPVDEFEAVEQKRIATHAESIQILGTLDTFPIGRETVDEIDSRLLTLMELRARDWQEFSDGANRLIGRLETSLPELRRKFVKQEEERAELERLRKADAERQEQERKAQVEREQKERDERVAAIARESAEVEAKKAIEKAEKAAEDAKAAAKRAKDRAEFERIAAVEAEQRRVAQAKAAEEAETKKREADKKHLAKINNAALASLMKAFPESWISEKTAKAVIVAIASGKVAHVKIEY